MRAGKSVLIIDQTDVYGSDEASFTLDGLLGSRDPSLNPSLSHVPVTQASLKAAGEVAGELLSKQDVQVVFCNQAQAWQHFCRCLLSVQGLWNHKQPCCCCSA